LTPLQIRDQTAENAEITQRFSGFFLGELRASSANSAVKEVFAVASPLESQAWHLGVFKISWAKESELR
jgi:hypothetical protein